MTTTSTSFSFVTIASLASRKVRNGLRFGYGKALAAIRVDLVGVDGGQTREAQHAPGGLVAIAAMNGIGEEPFHVDREKRSEELFGVQAVEFGRAFFHRGQRFVALLLLQPVEGLAVGFLAPRI